jgi:hypothetical protein
MSSYLLECDKNKRVNKRAYSVRRRTEEGSAATQEVVAFAPFNTEGGGPWTGYNGQAGGEDPKISITMFAPFRLLFSWPPK